MEHKTKSKVSKCDYNRGNDCPRYGGGCLNCEVSGEELEQGGDYLQTPTVKAHTQGLNLKDPGSKYITIKMEVRKTTVLHLTNS